MYEDGHIGKVYYHTCWHGDMKDCPAAYGNETQVNLLKKSLQDPFPKTLLKVVY